MNRSKFNTFRIILLTSLFWVFMDVFLIFYLIDCSSYCIKLHQSFEQQYMNKQSSLSKNKISHVNSDQSLKLKIQRFHELNKLEIKSEYIKSTLNSRIINSSFKKEKESKEETKIIFNPKNWPGENGNAVFLPDDLKQKAKKRFKENQFNVVASDLIALNRSIPDVRLDTYVLFYL